MSHAARLTLSVLALVVVLFFATSAYADSSVTITFTGTPVASGAYAGFSASGNLEGTFTPDGLGDGGDVVTSLTSGSVAISYGSSSTAYTENGLVPLDPASPSPSNPAYDAYYICDTPTCFHYWGYDNLLYPGTPDLSDGLLFFLTGITEPVELFCSNAGVCDLGVWLDGADNGNDPYDAGFEYLPVTIQETTNAPEPSTLLLLGLGMLMLAGFGRRTWLARSADLA